MRIKIDTVDPALHPHHEGVEFLLMPLRGSFMAWGARSRSLDIEALLNWCAEQFGPEGSRWSYEPDCLLVFHKKSDAVLFRLAWIEDDAHLPT